MSSLGVRFVSHQRKLSDKIDGNDCGIYICMTTVTVISNMTMCATNITPVGVSLQS